MKPTTLRDFNLKLKTLSKSDSSEPVSSEQSEGETKVDENKKQAYLLNPAQRCRVFACICVARHLHGAGDNDDSFDLAIHETTLKLLKPHLKLLDFDKPPPYNVVRRVWTDFIRTGLVSGKVRSTNKPVLKSQRLSRSDYILNSDDKKRKIDSSSSYVYYGFIGALLLTLLFFLTTQAQNSTEEPASKSKNSIQIDYNRVDEINQRFPDLLARKSLNMIKTRLAVMRNEVSILMLIGSDHDVHCRQDPTYCVGLMIANVSQYLPYGYIDASDPKLTTNQLIGKLTESFDTVDESGVVVIDNLNKLPGGEVMNLFQFIDKDEYKKRHGLLLLILYTDNKFESSKMRNADIAEKVLSGRWSSHVPQDTLTSVISRISGTIVKVN